MVHGPLRWIVGPVVLTLLSVVVVSISSYALVGDAPRFLGGSITASSKAGGPPAGMERRGPPGGEGIQTTPSIIGGVAGSLAKSLGWIGIPGAMTFWLSRRLYAHTGTSPEAVNDAGMSPD
jgi:hypothetical protein